MQILGKDIFDRSLNIRVTEMPEYLSQVRSGEGGGSLPIIPECVSCKWFGICQPATLPWDGAEMRYRRDTGFQNKLVHCDAFQRLFISMDGYLQRSVVPPYLSEAPSQVVCQLRPYAAAQSRFSLGEGMLPQSLAFRAVTFGTQSTLACGLPKRRRTRAS